MIKFRAMDLQIKIKSFNGVFKHMRVLIIRLENSING